MAAQVQVIVTGPTGSGKSAIYGEIALALEAIGVPVVHADPKAWQSECNMTGADWEAARNLYRPTVVMAEQSQPRPAPPEPFWRRMLRQVGFPAA